MLGNSYAISQVKQVIGAAGNIVSDVNIINLLTDSRKISNPVPSLFFALKGRHDAHDFIPEVYRAGVRNFVVNKTVPEWETWPDANFLIVTDVLRALQTLAAWHRSHFNFEVIGITGSNGKTIVKEWLYQLLGTEKQIVRNPKSYNSQLGVALSVWQMASNNNMGIFEAGISTVHEMEYLEPMIRPAIGVLTHMGAAHNEGFKSAQQKLGEKLKLFVNSDLFIYQADTLKAFTGRIPGRKRFTWSRRIAETDLFVSNEGFFGESYHLKGLFRGDEIDCAIPFTDEASIENAITCWAVLLALGYQQEFIKAGLARLSPVSMRMELKQGVNNCSIIDDSYNSDIQSLEIALNFLNQQNQHQTRTLILSDIFQSGLDDQVLYRQIANLLREKKINKFIGIGVALVEQQQLFDTNQRFFFKDTEAFLKCTREVGFQNETILIKGSRSFEFEKISRALVQKAHETVMEINLNAMQNNLNYYKTLLKPGVKLMAMVKAFSYGSGSFEVANLLQFNKVDYLAVAYIDEGIALRNAGIKLPIMVLNPETSAFDKLIDFSLEPEIYSFNLFEKFMQFAQIKKLNAYPVHLKIDTGMHRLGFEEFEIAGLCHLIKQNCFINIRSIFSHLAASDAALHDYFTLQQLICFENAYKQIETALGHTVVKHIANTSAISRWPQAQFEMVRLGIGLYGVDAAIAGPNKPLQPVATLKTSISQIKAVKAGDTIGYSRKGQLAFGGKIAAVRIGYADGYLRAFGNGVGRMVVNGKIAPTVGNISMDMCTIDVSGIEVKEGDEVIVFNEDHPIEDMAKQINTIPYEILTNVSQRVKRVYFYE